MPLASFTLWTGLGAGIWVTVLTVIGFTIGSQTADMSYAELVYSGKDLVGQHLRRIIPLLVVGFIVYVYLSKRIMRSSPSPVE